MAKQRPVWVKDAKVFAGFTLLNFALVCAGWCCSNGALSGQIGEAWFLVFATPVFVAYDLGWSEVTKVLLWFNPLIYGLMWWGIWRAVKLFRTKPVE